MPLSIGTANYDFDVPATKDHGEKRSNANVNSVGARYFETMGIPVLPIPEGAAAFVRELQHLNHDPAEVDVVVAARSGS